MATSTKLNLDEDQKDFLSNYGVHLKGLACISGSNLHDYMIRNDAYTDGEFLVFFDDYKGGNSEDQNKYLYYMGAENEAELVAKYLGITIYEGISQERLGRYL